MMKKSEATKNVADFITAINEQDNRCTAAPYFYVIRDVEYVSSYHNDEWDRLSGYDPESSTCESGKTMQEVLDQFIENETVEKPDEEMDSYDIEEYLKGKNIEVFREKKSYVNKGMFLTETDAENHLKSNHYHYSKDAITYVDHAWRAPELELFLKSVGIMCDVPFKGIR